MTTTTKKYYNSNKEIDLNESEFLDVHAMYFDHRKTINVMFSQFDWDGERASTVIICNDKNWDFTLTKLTRKNTKLEKQVNEKLKNIPNDVLLEIYHARDKERLINLLTM